MNRFSLMPGVYLTMIPTDKFKTNCLSINLLRPLCEEEAALNALLPDVLLRGCKMCPDMGSIAAWLDHRYGAGVQATCRKKGEVQAIGFFLDFIEESFAPEERLTENMCRLMGSFLLEPVLDDGVFRSDYVEGERINLINAIESQINNKRTYAAIRLRQTMYVGERYGVGKYGTLEQVKAITAQGLYAHYRRVLETSQVEIIYTGSLPKQTVERYLMAALGSLPRGQLLPVETELGPWPQQPKELVETMDVTQGKLVIGFRTGITSRDPRYPALRMLNGIYGGSLSSKLFLNVREKLSLCYYASSGIDTIKGNMVVSSGVDGDKYETAKKEIFAQLEDCRQGKITQEEMEATRKGMISGIRSSVDSPYNMDDYYLGKIISGHSYDPDTMIRAIEQVTLKEIQDVANAVKLDTIYFLKGEQA